MKKQAWITYFIVILTVHLAGMVLKIKLVEYVSKPMIVVLLIFYFLSQTNKINSGYKKWILAALFFSCAGDVLPCALVGVPSRAVVGLVTNNRSQAT